MLSSAPWWLYALLALASLVLLRSLLRSILNRMPVWLKLGLLLLTAGLLVLLIQNQQIAATAPQPWLFP